MYIKLLAAYLPAKLAKLHDIPSISFLDGLLELDRVHEDIETPLLISPKVWYGMTCGTCGVLYTPLVYAQGKSTKAQHYHDHEQTGGIYILHAEPQEVTRRWAFAAFEVTPDHSQARMPETYNDIVMYNTPAVTLTRALWAGKCVVCNNDPDDYYVMKYDFIFGRCNDHNTSPNIVAPSPYLPVVTADGRLTWRMR